jgi:hypothetical protein
VPDDALHEEVRDRNWIPFEADDGFNGLSSSADGYAALPPVRSDELAPVVVVPLRRCPARALVFP